jgi:hypothetical protein
MKIGNQEKGSRRKQPTSDRPRSRFHPTDVVLGRVLLKSLQWLLFSPTARKVLADQLRALLPKGALLGPRHFREIRFKPGHQLRAYLDVDVQRAAHQGVCTRPIEVSWGSKADSEETADLAQMQAEAVRRGVAAPFLRLLGDFPERNMRVLVSPLDARFTQLVRLSDPQHVRARLADAYASADGSDQHPIREYTVTFIKYRPGKRHVLRYDPVGGATAEAVFAKLYVGAEAVRVYRREDGARAFRVAQGVADWLAAHGEGVNGLRPLAYVAEDAVVLYPRLGGVPLSDYATRPRGVVAPCLQQAGAALATLHHVPVALAGRPEPHDLAAEIRTIRQKSHYIPALLPQVGPAIETVFDRAQELHRRLPQEPPTFTHGDLKTEHIWATPGGITVMDFDSSRPADPALDVGYFLADWWFRQTAHDRAGADDIYKSFLAGYAPGVPKERLLRARLYEAVELVKCAVRRTQLFESDWASRVAGLVERAEALLHELQPTLASAA